MSAIVTDNFRILNASNFVDSVNDSVNSYYVFVGLSNPTTSGFGRDSNWDTTQPNPIDSVDYLNHYESTILFGKKITGANIRRAIRKIDWITGTQYEMYRPDYSVINPSPTTGAMRLYDANYYVLNSEYKVYICIDNGSSGIKTTGNSSEVEPTFTDLEPTKLSDGYTWKYLYTVSPSDIIKFDSSEYITLPNDWETSTDSQIVAVRENGDSTINQNQIKKIFIKNQGQGYTSGTRTCNLVGDGSGGTVSVTVNSSTKISDVTVTSGGKNYTYALVDLGTTSSNTPTTYAELIPIIPPSKGHGFDLYKELGADKILIYARFDDSTKDLPIDTKFSQVGIIKNPTYSASSTVFDENAFSGLFSIKLSSIAARPIIGEEITQVTQSGQTARGYVASFDSDIMVLKYFRDRSLYFNQTSYDQKDYIGISTSSKVLDFESSANPITGQVSGFSGSIDTGFSGISTNPTGNRVINLGAVFTNGLANAEINKGSGDIIYLDNRPLISRNSRQKEDVKIILEF